MDAPPTPICGKRVAVIIVNWNAWAQCIECLDTLLAQDYQDLHIYIVDNDSRDDSVERIGSWCDRPWAEATWRRHPEVKRLTDRAHVDPVGHRIVERNDQASPPPPEGCLLTLVRSGANLGFAGGCNIGIRTAGIAQFDYFWFLNADTVVDRRALVELVSRAERSPETGMVGSTIRFYDDPDVVQAMAGARLNCRNGTTSDIGHGTRVADLPADCAKIERQLSYIMGASMLVSAGYIAAIGLMAEDYFLYYEDVDWAWRGRGLFSLGYAPSSYIFHKWGASSHKAVRSFSTKLYYGNRLRFVARYFPGRVPWTVWSLFDQLLRHILRGRWSAAGIVLYTILKTPQLTAGVMPAIPARVSK